MTFIIILSVIIVILLLVLLYYKRQVKYICRQLAFLRKHKSNMMISSEMESGGLRELKDEINEILKENRHQQKLYMEKERMIAETYTNLSHDIRTPLTSLDGYFQLLQEAENEEDKQRYIRIISERVQSLTDMLEELFTYTKLENESYQLELTSCNICKILKETILSYYEDWLNHGIKPTLSIPDKALFVNANANAFHRVIQNIIKNVLEHGEKEIWISLKEVEQHIVLTISNQVSHPEEIQIENVFERFYKADLTRGKTSTGLGLSIAYGLIQKMKGSIYATLNDQIFSIIIEMEIQKN